MTHFSTKTRIRVSQGYARLSIRSDEGSVDEYWIPVNEFQKYADSKLENFVGMMMEVKAIGSQQFFIKLKESDYKRITYTFSSNELAMMKTQFIHATLSASEEDLMEASASIANSPFEAYIERRLDTLDELVHSMDGEIKLIHQTLTKLIDVVSNLQIPSATTTTIVTSSESAPLQSSPLDMDDELFIPTSFKQDFVGQVIHKTSISDGSTDDASEALKKLRKNKNKEG